MKFLQQFFNFYVSLSIHVALAVYSLVKITEFYFNFPPNKQLNYTIFFGTIVGYNLVKLNQYPLKKITHVKIISSISFGLAIFFGWQLNLKTILLFIPFGLLTYLYTSPFLSLRNIPSIKIVLIAFVWASVTVLIPILNADIQIDFKVILIYIQRFLIIIVLTLPFDIRDFQFDKRHLQTIPQLIGVERTKKFGFILMTIAMLIEFFVTPNQISKSTFILMFLTLITLLQRASINQSKHYSAFWVEAIPIFWWSLFFLIDCYAVKFFT